MLGSWAELWGAPVLAALQEVTISLQAGVPNRLGHLKLSMGHILWLLCLLPTCLIQSPFCPHTSQLPLGGKPEEIFWGWPFLYLTSPRGQRPHLSHWFQPCHPMGYFQCQDCLPAAFSGARMVAGLRKI